LKIFSVFKKILRSLNKGQNSGRHIARLSMYTTLKMTRFQLQHKKKTRRSFCVRW